MSEEFVNVLHALTLPPGPDHRQAEEIITAMKATDRNAFLQTVIPFIPTVTLPPQIRQMAAIIAGHVFPEPHVEEEPFAGLARETVSALLDASFQSFPDENQQTRSIMAGLFAKVAVLGIDEFGILPILLGALNSPPSITALEAVFMAMNDVLKETELNADEMNEVLRSLFNYLGSGDVPPPVKNVCLVLLQNVIDGMGDILTEEENVGQLFGALAALSSIPETKAKAFDVWTQITVQYYPMLELVLGQIVDATFIELTNGENDREVLISVCMFWEAVAECEMGKDNGLGIINGVAERLLPILFGMCSAVPSEECDFEETFEPHTAAGTTMQGVVRATRDAAMPVLAALVQQFHGSPNVGERESALHCINFMIQFCNVTPLLEDCLKVVFERLKDPAPRVRETAIYCVHALLLSILDNGDNCLFAAAIPAIRQYIGMFALAVMTLAKEDCVEVAATAASCIADFVRFPGFPYVPNAMAILLGTILRGDLRLSDCAFSALQNIVQHVSDRIAMCLLAAVTDILDGALKAEGTDFVIIQHFFCLLQNLLARQDLCGQLGERTPVLWGLINTGFTNYPDEASSFLSPLAALARCAGPPFAELLPQVATFLMNGLVNMDSDSAIPNAAFGISLLSDAFDLSPFAPQFLEALTAAMANEGVSLEKKRFVANAIAGLARTVPAVFVPLSEAVMPPIIAVSSAIRDIVERVDIEDMDDVDMDKIILSFAECYRVTLEVIAAAQLPFTGAVAEALIDVLEYVGSLREHTEILLSGCVDIMAWLITTSPDLMREYFANEPGFEVIVKSAMEAGVGLESVQQIVAFCS